MIIGQPKNVEGFQPITPEEFAYLRQPLDDALSQGVPLNQPAAVDFTVLCRLLSTVVAMSRELQKYKVAAATAEDDQPTPIASLSDDITDPVVDAGTSEEPPLPFVSGRRVILPTDPE
jgi:hypothetical protein